MEAKGISGLKILAIIKAKIKPNGNLTKKMYICLIFCITLKLNLLIVNTTYVQR